MDDAGCRLPICQNSVLWINYWLWKKLRSLTMVQPVSKTSSNMKKRIYFTAHVSFRSRNRSLLLRGGRAKNTPKQRCFRPSHSSLETGLSTFNFAISFKQRQILSDVASRCRTSFITFLSGFRFSEHLSWSISKLEGRPLRSWSLRLLSPVRHFLNYHCAVHSIVISWPNASLITWAVFAAFLPAMNWMKKIMHICCFFMLSEILKKCNSYD